MVATFFKDVLLCGGGVGRLGVERKVVRVDKRE